MNKIVFLALAFFSFKSYSQNNFEIRGSILDTLNVPLTGANIKLISNSDTLSLVADFDGKFVLRGVKPDIFKISVSLIGFQSFSQSFDFTKGESVTIPPIHLKIQSHLLQEVTITGVNPIVIKEDTIQYNASAYPVREGAPVEDIVKKLPGVTVDKDGNITAHGKPITRIRVNGKDFFGGDVQTATQNLPADIIENLQIIDDYGDQANLTGIKSGESEKILNITIQKGKRKGYFGNSSLAGGTEYRYMGKATGNIFKDEQQISFLTSLNNTNANTFNFNGGGKGGSSRGVNLGSNERSNNAGDGIALTKSAGVNYRDMWGEKIKTYGSYSFSERGTNTIGSSFQQDFNPMNISNINRISNINTTGSNHRLTYNLEYQIDSANYVKITPYFSNSYSVSENQGDSEISRLTYYTVSNTQSENTTSSPGTGSGLVYNHKFAKWSRNFNLSTGFDYSRRNQDRDTHNSYFNTDSTFINPLRPIRYRYQFTNNDANNFRTNMNASYVEPLAKTMFLEFSYGWNKSSTSSSKDVNDIDPVSGIQTFNSKQSNSYEYQFITNRFGLNLRSIKSKYNYTLGLVAQPSVLNGYDIVRDVNTKNNSFNFKPTARFVYNFSKNNSFTFNYGGVSREPSFTQLQPVRDSSFLWNIVVGNPDLKAEFINRLSFQYNKFNTLKGESLFANLSFDQTQNKIVTNRIYDSVGTGRTTSYLNTNGFYSFNGNVSYTKPFAERKYSLSLGATANFDNNLSFTDNQKNNGQNWLVRPFTRFRLDLEDIVDAELHASYTINKFTTRYPTNTNTTQANTLIAGINGSNYLFKDWTIGYDLTKVLNYGYAFTTNSNPTLLSLYFERQFLKNNMATVRIQGFDLFNQNTGISREINGSIVTDSQNNRLGRYFLMSFSFRIQKFAGKMPNRDNLKKGLKRMKQVRR